MPVAALVLVSEAEYLDFEASSLERHEFVNGELLAMAGVTIEHKTGLYRAGVDAILLVDSRRRLVDIQHPC